MSKMRRTIDRPLSTEERATWLDAIERNYGVRLTYENDVYSSGALVYAASTYVARLGATNHPDDATEWASSFGHRPLATRIESAPLRESELS